MRNQEFYTALQTALQPANRSTHTAHQKQTATLAAHALAHRQKPLSFGAFLRAQVRFIGWKIWLVQALCLLFANNTLHFICGAYYFVNPRLMMQCLCCLSVLVMLTALPFISNASLYRMHETEAATHFSSLRLLAAKLLLVGLGDLAILAGIWGYSLYFLPLTLRLLPCCLFLPFLLAASGVLTMLERLTPQRFCLGSIAWCILLCALFIFSSHRLPSFGELFLPGLLLSLTLLFYCLYRLHHLLQNNRFTEQQLL